MWGTFSNLTQTLQDKIDEAVDDIKNSSMEEDEAGKVISIYIYFISGLSYKQHF